MAYKKKTPEERRAEIDKAFKTIEENIPTALDNDTFKDSDSSGETTHTVLRERA